MLANVDHSTIWRIEQGLTVPHKGTQKAIADALDIHPSEIAEFAPTQEKG
jgi:transcriptional regulator with XRE-family HTH domain